MSIEPLTREQLAVARAIARMEEIRKDLDLQIESLSALLPKRTGRPRSWIDDGTGKRLKIRRKRAMTKERTANG